MILECVRSNIAKGFTGTLIVKLSEIQGAIGALQILHHDILITSYILISVKILSSHVCTRLLQHDSRGMDTARHRRFPDNAHVETQQRKM